MKHATFKRWIFIALLLLLIAGTILGHADVAQADQSHAAISGQTPAVLEQTLAQIAQKTKKSEDAAATDLCEATPLALEFMPLTLPFVSPREPSH